MRGDDNHERLGEARALGPARTSGRYALVHCGAYPAMVDRSADDQEPGVWGELYEIDARYLAALDEYEGHPELFVRSSVTLASGAAATAYLLPEERARPFPRIDSGRWKP
jgi:gamma-glutamylaminecyclotransferase